MSRHSFGKPLGPLVLAALFLCLPGLATAEEPMTDRDREAVQQVINGQISAFKADDSSAAYSFAAPSVRNIFSNEKMFINMVQRDYKPLYRPVSYTFGRSSLEAGEVLQELLVTDRKRQLWQVIYTLERQEDKSWKITNVLMFAYKGVSA